MRRAVFQLRILRDPLLAGQAVDENRLLSVEAVLGLIEHH
jgi:hypothetical protein